LKACRTASIFAMGGVAVLFAASAIGACREAATPEIPPVTTASPDGAPVLGASTASLSTDGAAPRSPADSGMGPSVLAPALESPVKAKFVDAPAKIEAGVCHRALLAVVKGKVTVLNETLSPGDVLVVTHAEPFDVAGVGTLVSANVAVNDCAVLPKPSVVKTLVRAAAAPKLEWAGGTMAARLDVSSGSKGPPVSPEVYFGRLEGTAAVGEHNHGPSWEILAAVEANGTFVIDGTEARLASRQIVVIPPGVKHAWKPEPGSKLVAVQMYSPPGPELRFIGLAAAEKDAGAAVKDAGARDAR
jgi:mannose-6-phosphate isomerase-like protein (cupin superfamily)